jgi:polar amino acid transport system substrate-binding protein
MLKGLIALAAFPLPGLLATNVLMSAPAAAAPVLVAPGMLTYAVAASFTPFEYQENGADTGFDIEFGAAIAGKMGLMPMPMNIDFGGLIPALEGHRVDIINSAMYIKPARAAVADFIPYMRIGEEIIVKAGNPLGVRTRIDLCGHRVAVTLGAIEATYVDQDEAACKAAGKPPVTTLILPTGQDTVLAVRQGRADALYDSSPGAAEIIADLPGAFEIAGPSFDNCTLIGVAVRKGDTAMKTAVEAAIKAAVADGTYAALLKKYNLPASGSIF